ncbi:unnamed protein product [Didymodactylos carnosus]|uniref:CS domain-containing protein n=1 Tax=Didymodactylos carnosus TaxID=1234261 RepID=A0A813QMF0_9BILA|nr:unnamed protein product [Didymodactylos carnosus]CAF3552451.1 unnamed protein product [Didymodactylos carnosus]
MTYEEKSLCLTEDVSTNPHVKWAQKKDSILLTIAVQDIEKPEIQIEPAKLHFKGKQKEGPSYDTTLEFFEEIDPQVSKYRSVGQSHWEFMLKKKDTSKPFWKRLVKPTNKVSWITVDWDKYNDDGNDEDDMEAGADGKDWGDLDGMFKQMGGAGGMGNYGKQADLNDLDDENEMDSDDEALPDLEDVPKDSEEQKKDVQEIKPTTI